HTRFKCDWSSDVCSSDLDKVPAAHLAHLVDGIGELKAAIFRVHGGHRVRHVAAVDINETGHDAPGWQLDRALCAIHAWRASGLRCSEETPSARNLRCSAERS